MESGKQVLQPGRRGLSTYVPVYLSTFLRLLLWLLPLTFLGVAFFYPLSRILALTFDSSTLTSENLQLAGRVLVFTFYQAALSTLLTLLLGLPAAYLFARYDFPGKSFLRALTIIPFMLPTVVVAAGFSALLGPRGVVHVLLPSLAFNFMGTLSAILVAHVFYNTAIVIRIVGNAISSMDPRLEAAARSLGADPVRVWRHVTFPLLRPAIMASALLVFLFDFTSFGVILLLGGSQFATLEVEIYLRVLKLPNLSLAALLAMIQLACTLVVSILYARMVARSTTQTAPRSEAANVRKPKSLREKVFVSGFIILLAAFFFCLFLHCRFVPSSVSKRIAASAVRSNMGSPRIITRSFSSTGAARSFMSPRSVRPSIHWAMPG